MVSNEVREIEKRISLWGGYRDELVATAMTLSLLVLGTFLITERLIQKPTPKISQEVLQAAASAVPQTLGVQDVAPSAATMSATQLDTLKQYTQAASTASEGALVHTEVPYGEPGMYEFLEYSIEFSNPRISFDQKSNGKRQLLVDVLLANKAVAEGIDVRLTASIVKDGNVIVKEAALSLPDSRALGKGETLRTTASLGLIDATDVRELKYKPGHNLASASHFLYP